MKPLFYLMILSAGISLREWARSLKKLKELKIVRRSSKRPHPVFVHVVRTGNLLFLSGKGPADSAASVLRRHSRGKEPFLLKRRSGGTPVRLTKLGLFKK